MNRFSLFFTTDVRSPNISKLEVVANIFLRPVQYLWKGRKIELLHTPDLKAIAGQMREVFPAEKRSWTKSALMVALLVPSLLVGSFLKLLALCRGSLSAPEKECLKVCLKQKQVLEKGKFIYSRTKDKTQAQQLARNITTLVCALRQADPTVAQEGVLLLSDLRQIKLLPKSDPRAAQLNQDIVNNLALLYHLRHLDVCDHYDPLSGSIQPRPRLATDPSVRASLHHQSRTYASASAFFNSLELTEAAAAS